MPTDPMIPTPQPVPPRTDETTTLAPLLTIDAEDLHAAACQADTLDDRNDAQTALRQLRAELQAQRTARAATEARDTAFREWLEEALRVALDDCGVQRGVDDVAANRARGSAASYHYALAEWDRLTGKETAC